MLLLHLSIVSLVLLLCLTLLIIVCSFLLVFVHHHPVQISPLFCQLDLQELSTPGFKFHQCFLFTMINFPAACMPISVLFHCPLFNGRAFPNFGYCLHDITRTHTDTRTHAHILSGFLRAQKCISPCQRKKRERDSERERKRNEAKSGIEKETRDESVPTSKQL